MPNDTIPAPTFARSITPDVLAEWGAKIAWWKYNLAALGSPIITVNLSAMSLEELDRILAIAREAIEEGGEP